MKESSPSISASSTAPRTTWERAQAALRHHRGNPYLALRELLRILVPYRWRRNTVHFVRRRFGLLSLRDWLTAQGQTQSSQPTTEADLTPKDFYEAVTLLPHLPQAEVKAILKQPLAQTTFARPDIVCFSIIDWSFRFQRPQQLMKQFAAAGHRVFYLNISDFLSPHARPKFSARPIEIEKNLYEIKLASRYPLDLFSGVVGEKDAAGVLDSLDDLRRAYNINEAVGYVMIPSWTQVARATQRQWGWRIVYDCMDEWENFPRVQPESLAMERELVRSSDLLVVTAQRLYDKWQSRQASLLLARNAADYDFYAERCRPNELLREVTHPVVGYYGAIADWFDVELLAEVARRRPNYSFVLLGGVFDVDVSSLQTLPNVKLLGQQPYETMPEYLYHFDVCVIPFKINPITEATDPVKFYEYLSGGKPVVSVKLPELEPYRDFVYLAEDAGEFAAQIDRALAENSEAKAAERRALAQRHSWAERRGRIAEKIAESIPRASIIIVTYNNLALTKLCLESVFRNTEYPNYEVIVVDNQSKDDTPDYLRTLAQRHNNLKIILNNENYGFAKANNQGIAQATGEDFVLLNNDTVVPPGWLSRLLRHLRDPRVGAVGPVTNFVGNEAKIEVSYRSWIGMEAFVRDYTWQHQGQVADIHMLAMFCLALRREVYERIGPLDEQFGIGMFEDDDYSVRLRNAGLRLLCARDAFVHHFGQAAFGKLIESGQYDGIFDENRRRYETKWNVVWQPHEQKPLTFARHDFDEKP